MVDGTITLADGMLTWKEIEPNTPSITINNAPETLGIGKFTTLTADIKRTTGNPTITWTSGDEDIATVNDEGKVTGVAEGNVTITATINVNGTNYSGTCQVTIISPPKRGDYIILNSRAITGVGPANTDNTSNTSNEDDWMILYNGIDEKEDDDKKGLFIIMSNYLPNAYKANDNDSDGVAKKAGLSYGTSMCPNYGVYGSSLINKLMPTNETNSTQATAALAWKSLISNEIITSYQTTKVYGAITIEIMNKIKGTSGYYKPWTIEYQKCIGYWLASNSGNSSFPVKYISYSGAVGQDVNNSWTSKGILPIVILPQDVQLKKNTNGVWEVVIPTTNNN